MSNKISFKEKVSDEKNSQKKSFSSMIIILSSLKMSLATLTSRFLGLIREQVMAMMFGASGMTDAFLVAYRIPNLLRDLFAEGAFSSAFVPIFTEVGKKNGNKKARELFWAVAILLSLITLVIGVLIFIFAPELISLFAPSFIENKEKYEITINLTRLMSPFLLCVSIAALFMGVLNTLKIFFMPALSPAFFNVIMIVMTLGLPPILIAHNYSPIYALGMAVLIGGIVQAFVQLPFIYKKNFGPIYPKKIFSTAAKKVLARLGPGLIGFAANQINLLVVTVLASSLVGAVSWLNYAFRAFQFPIGIFSVSIASSHLVHFSESIKEKDFKKAKSYLSTSYQFSLFLMIPAMFLMVGLSREIIHILFERGKFNYSDTLMTAEILVYYSVGLPFYGIYKIFVPTFYALDKHKIPVIMTIFAITLNIIFCMTLTPYYGAKILAFGTSLTMVFNCLGLAYFLNKILGHSWNFFITKRIVKCLVSGAVCYLVVTLLSHHYFNYSDSILKKLFYFIIISLVGGGSYLVLIYLLGEKKNLKNLLSKK